MSVKLKARISDYDLLLTDTHDEEELSDWEAFEEVFPDVGTGIDKEGFLRYFHVELWEGTPDYLDYIISYLESHPVPGAYTVEELGLYDVPFVEVLKAIRKLYQQKLATQTQK